MTLPEACDLIVDLTCQLREEKALRMSLEADVTSYRELLLLTLRVLHDQHTQLTRARRERYRLRDAYRDRSRSAA
jgi:hypothetical protein